MKVWNEAQCLYCYINNSGQLHFFHIYEFLFVCSWMMFVLEYILFIIQREIQLSVSYPN